MKIGFINISKLHLRLLISIGIAIMAPGLLHAQMNVNESEVKSRFGSDSLWWITTYDGLWSDFHEVEILLGYDGAEYHGAVYYGSSKMSFDLIGERSSGQTILFEQDAQGRQVGMLQVDVTDTRVEGVWWNPSLTHQASIRMLKSTSTPIQKFAPALSQYRTVIKNKNGDPVFSHLLVHQEAPQQVSGHILIPGRPFIFKFAGECANTTCSKWEADIFNETDIVGRMHGKAKKDELLITWFEIDSTVKKWNMRRVASAPVSTSSYLNFNGSIDVSTIDLKASVFDNFLNEKIEKWWSNNLLILKKETDIENLSADERQQNAWNAWLEIGYFDQTILTGMLVLSGGEKNENHPFIFDRSKEEFLEWGDLFQKNTSEGNLRTTFVSDKRKDLITEQAKTYDDWVAKTAFDHAYFRTDGWVITSQFNPVYGIAEIVIPFAQFKNEIKKKSLLSAIYR